MVQRAPVRAEHQPRGAITEVRRPTSVNLGCYLPGIGVKSKDRFLVPHRQVARVPIGAEDNVSDNVLITLRLARSIM